LKAIYVTILLNNSVPIIVVLVSVVGAATWTIIKAVAARSIILLVDRPINDQDSKEDPVQQS